MCVPGQGRGIAEQKHKGRAADVTQWVKCFSSMHKALGLMAQPHRNCLGMGAH